MSHRWLWFFGTMALVATGVVAAVLVGPDETVDAVRGWTDRLQSVATEAPEQELAARRGAPGEGSLLMIVTAAPVRPSGF